ncbi:hypothetical protein RDWZM_010425 [Blomia tropicalis]|uniref:UDP-glycosyltransferase n=1 Tax=Blomia tropicalis TaxID=40697 RepID=A0A9Q0LYG7_BLOTA|nr:hypothetical protein RDWZM_010425 [Blomia tropicalis]
MTRKLKIFFHMLDLVGPQNACIGLGQVLLQRGHQVYFLTKSDNRIGEKFSKYGFTVIAVGDEKEKTKEEVEIERMEELKMIQSFGLFKKQSTLENLKSVLNDEMSTMMHEVHQKQEPVIKELIEKEKPDLIVSDSIGVCPPSLKYSGIPWVSIYCSNPLGLFKSKQLPPPTSGFPTYGSQDGWEDYWVEYLKLHDDKFSIDHHHLLEMFNYPSEPFEITSPYLNIYQFPKELDYTDVIQLPDTFVRVDAFCRDEISDYQLPEHFRNKFTSNDKLIYFSLGSIGNCNLDLLKRVISILGRTKYFCIISKGAFHDKIELPDNCYGENFLPQTKILPMVDLAIIHGGNNSLTESFYFGKPVIVMPLFYDQFDNAQRVDEKGYGVRIDPYDFKDEYLIEVIEKLLNDQELNQKMKAISQRIQSDQSKLNACIRMEQLVIDNNDK